MKKSIGYRRFLLLGDEALPLSKTTFEEFTLRRRAALPAFAGQAVDIATVVCKIENKKPKEVVRIYCQRFRVNGDGSMRDDIDTVYPPRSPTREKGASAGAHSEHGEPAMLATGEKARSFARSLVMMSGAAQRKIIQALWR